MALTRTDENELLTALHGGLFEPAPWRLFLDRLRARTDADVARLAIRPPGAPDWRPVDSVRRLGLAVGALAGDPAFEDLRDGRVYAASELPGAQPVQARHLRVAFPGSGELALSILREGEDFRARDAALLGGLSPHLAIALRAAAQVARMRRHAALGEAMGRAYATGWLLLDARGRVLDGDETALARVEEGGDLRRNAAGRLRLRRVDAQYILDAALAEDVVTPRAEWLSVGPPVQMAVMPPPAPAMTALADAHCFLALRVPDRPPEQAARLMTDLFGLTRGEAVLAGHLADGRSIAEAAEAMGLTLETARNYTKRIYGKTSARGQAELVRLVLNGVPVAG